MLERLRSFKFLLNVQINLNVKNRIWFELHNRADHNEYRQLIIDKKDLDVLFEFDKMNLRSLSNSFKILFLGPEKFWINLFLSLRIKEVHSMSFQRFAQVPFFLKKTNIKSFEYQHGLINFPYRKFNLFKGWEYIDVIYVDDIKIANYCPFNNFKYSEIVNNYVKCGLKESKQSFVEEDTLIEEAYWVESDYFSHNNREKVRSLIKKYSLIILKHPKNLGKGETPITVLDKNKNVYGYFSSKMLKLRAEGYNVIQVKLSENDEFYHRIYELAEINLDKK